MAKAKGFVLSIDSMDSKGRASTPSSQFGEDYNQLRRLTAELFSDLVPVLPPAVPIEKTDYGSHFTAQKFDELRTYCEQIYQLLADSEGSR